MANPWPTPNNRRDHVRYPTHWIRVTCSLSYLVQGCICSLCSGTRYTDPPAPRIPSEEHQDGWFPGVSINDSEVTLYSFDSGSSSKDPGVLQANRIIGVDNPTNIAAVTNGHWQTQAVPAVAPRAPVCIHAPSFYTFC
jgi:hypothetical protein